MRITPPLVIGGVAAIAIVGAAAAALNTHVLTVRLPGGGVERIVYTGNVAPRIEMAPAGAPDPIAWSDAPAFNDAAFAAMDRMSAQMDREMEAMFRPADSLRMRAWSDPAGVTFASNDGMPAGAQSFSFVSTMSGAGVCSRSVEITSSGNGQKPRVVSHSSGACGTADAPAPSRSIDAGRAPRTDGAGMVTASYHPTAHAASGEGPT
jgi:hypothetical protein